jgi:hypothetical protein
MARSQISGAVDTLLEDLHERKVVTKVRPLSTGRTVGGIPFARGSLCHLLRNRFYIGEVAYKGEVLPGEQPVILTVSRTVEHDARSRCQWLLSNRINLIQFVTALRPIMRRKKRITIRSTAIRSLPPGTGLRRPETKGPKRAQDSSRADRDSASPTVDTGNTRGFGAS